MAKGSAMGLWKGKKGSSVFYRIWNTNNKEAQGIREYRAEVRNPQSDGQADQRARLLPAQRIKGALRDIVSRSFQGIPYGSKSRLEFIRQAMRLKEGYPFVTKGYQEPVPGRYFISKGSLPQIITTDNDGAVESSLVLEIEIVGSTTIANFSADLLAKNPYLREGDQLTFVVCTASLPDAPDISVYKWFYYSVYLNSSDSTTFQDAGLMDYNFIIGSFETHLTLTEDGNIAASAIILSRKDEDGTYLRSTAQLAVADFMAPFFSPSQAVVTRASYQTQTTQNSTDWPVEEDTRGGGGSSVTDGAFTVSGLTGELAGFNGRQVKVRINTLTGAPVSVYVLDLTDDSLCDPTGAEISITITGGESRYLFKRDVPQLASLPSVLYS